MYLFISIVLHIKGLYQGLTLKYMFNIPEQQLKSITSVIRSTQIEHGFMLVETFSLFLIWN